MFINNMFSSEVKSAIHPCGECFFFFFFFFFFFYFKLYFSAFSVARSYSIIKTRIIDHEIDIFINCGCGLIIN